MKEKGTEFNSHGFVVKRADKFRCPRKLKKFLKSYTYLETPEISAYHFQIRERKSLFFNGKTFYKSI